MAFDFPNTPVIGQTANGYVWDGEKWAAMGSPSAPVMRTDALGWSGMQINGSMEVSQALGTSGVGLAGPTHILDGFKGFLAGTGAFGAQQQTVVPPGFVKSLFLNCTTANPLGGANDGQWLQTDIEGYRWSRLAWGTANAQPVTISFWVRTPIAGTMAVAVQDLASPYRTYVVDVAVTAANTWEYKTVTIPGDTGGIWNKDNLTGASVIFCFGVGSGRKTTANVWATQGTAVGTTATTNFFAAVGGAYLTGVVILPGIEAPTAAQSPLIMRPYDQELLTCQRYYEQIGIGQAGVGHCYAANGIYITINYLTKRTNPTITHTNPTGFQAYSANGSAMAISALGGASNIGLRGAMTFYTLVGSPAVGGHGTSLFTSLPNTSINIDARL